MVALGIWLLARTPIARIVATGLAFSAALVSVIYTVTRPTRPPVAGLRRYIDYLPRSPFHRDGVFSYDGASGADVGVYIGIGLIVLIAIAMSVVVVGEQRTVRTEQLVGAGAR